MSHEEIQIAYGEMQEISPGLIQEQLKSFEPASKFKVNHTNKTFAIERVLQWRFGQSEVAAWWHQNAEVYMKDLMKAQPGSFFVLTYNDDGERVAVARLLKVKADGVILTAYPASGTGSRMRVYLQEEDRIIKDYRSGRRMSVLRPNGSEQVSIAKVFAKREAEGETEEGSELTPQALAIKMLSVMSSKPRTIARIAHKAGIPNTPVLERILEKLLAANKVATVPVGRGVRWKTTL